MAGLALIAIPYHISKHQGAQSVERNQTIQGNQKNLFF